MASLSRVLRDGLEAFDAGLDEARDLVRLDELRLTATELLEKFVGVRCLAHQREDLDAGKIWLRHPLPLSIDADDVYRVFG